MKYFVDPIIVQEILAWTRNTGENPLVFEALAKACSAIGRSLLPDKRERAQDINRVFEQWCSSDNFVELLQNSESQKVGVLFESARKSISQFSGSESFVAGVAIDKSLSAFSALLRADLRTRDSRASVRIDELILWQGFSKAFDLHDIALLLLAACASNDVLNTFDKLLAIRSRPSSLIQVKVDELNVQSAPFTSAVRMFALANFESAEKGFELCLQSDNESPTFLISLCLLNLLKGNFDEASATLDRMKLYEPSCVISCIRYLIALGKDEALPFMEVEDPISFAVSGFALLRKREYTKLSQTVSAHLGRFPEDVLAYLLAAQSKIQQTQEIYFNDPPLPGAMEQVDNSWVNESESFLKDACKTASKLGLTTIESFARNNLALVALMNRKFQESVEHTILALRLNEDCVEAMLNQSIGYLALGNLPESLRALQGVTAPYSNYSGRIAAEAYFHACAFDEALEFWNRLQDSETDRLWQLRICCRMLESYRLQQDSRNGQNCVDKLLARFRNEPEALFALAFELWLLGRNEDAIHALQNAKEIAAPNLKRWIAWELGRIFFDAGQTLSATDEYLSVSNENIDSAQAREFAVALFKAGLKPAANKWAKLLREVSGDVIPGITEIETDYLVSDGKLEEAKQLLLKLSRKRPLSVMNRIAIARICATLGQEDEAHRELSEIRKLAISPELKEDVERFLSDLEIVRSIKAKQTS